MGGFRFRKKDSDKKSPRASCFRSLFKGRQASPTEMDYTGVQYDVGMRPYYLWAADAMDAWADIVKSRGSESASGTDSTDVRMEDIPMGAASTALAAPARPLGRASTEDIANLLAEMDRIRDLQAPFPTSPTINDIILNLESGRLGPNVAPAELMKKRGTDMNDFFIEATDDQLQVLERLLLKARKSYFKWCAIAQKKGDDEWFNPNKNFLTYTSKRVHSPGGSEKWTMPFTPMVPRVGAGPGDEGRLLRDLAREGIPNPLRMKVWLAISGASERMKAKTQYIWEHLAMQAVAAEATNLAAAERARDIRQVAYGGTFPMHKWLGKAGGEGPRALERVLLAYSQYNPKVGYCPGMNYVAGMMLISMQQQECGAFWMMVTLLEDFLLPNYYEQLNGCQAEIRVFKDLLKGRFPNVADHLDKLQSPPGLGIDLLMTEWFASLWASLLPSETCMRIYDVLLSEGFFIMYGVGLAIIGFCEAPLLDCHEYVSASSLLKDACRGMFNPDTLLASAIHELTTFVSPLTSHIIQSRAQLI